MSKLMVLGVAFLLLVAAFPLISFGTTGDNDTLWWLGLGMLVVGGLVPPVTRYLLPGEDQAEEEDGDGEDGDDEGGEPEERGRLRRADTEPAEIRVARVDGDGESRERESGEAPSPLGEHERLARAHEQRAEAHRERARAHEELAKAEEERARAEADGPDGGTADDRSHRKEQG